MANDLFEVIDVIETLEDTKNGVITYFTKDRKLKSSLEKFWKNQPNEYGNGLISKNEVQELFDKLREKEIVITMLLGTDFEERKRAKAEIENKLSTKFTADKDTIINIWNNYCEVLKDAISSKVSEEANFTANRTEDNIIQRLQETNNKIDNGIDTLSTGINNLTSEFQQMNRTIHSQQLINQNTPVQQNVDTLDEFTQEYIKNYEDDLFLEDGTGISLGKMYVEPNVVKHNDTLYDIINEWFNTKRKHPIMFVVGDAGIGKTSLVSKIIADSRGISEKPVYSINKDKIHPIILRSVIEEIETATNRNKYSVIDVLKSVAKIDSIGQENELIILDGLDELLELSKRFNLNAFIKRLCDDISAYSLKVLITTRPVDILDDIISDKIIKYNIEWKEKQIFEWCDNYSKFSSDEKCKQWCIDFKNNYTILSQNDPDGNKMSIFSVPVILYIACNQKITIDKNETIGSFYDKVFRSIADREHLEYSKDRAVLTTSTEVQRNNIINWQYTKELAYQMFLHDTLTLSDADLIRNAQKRTIDVLKEQKIVINDDGCSIDNLKYLAVCHFAKPTNDRIGILFAHKTVYEYFTAVKIYEDYFAKYNKDYFDEDSLSDDDKIQKVSELWHSFVEAFRYKEIPETILKYLCEMKKAEYDGTSNDNDNGLNDSTLKKLYEYGIDIDYWEKYDIESPIEEYKCNSNIVTEQIRDVYQNILLFSQYKNLEFDLSDADLSYAYLRYADLSVATLNNANLRYANLGYANLIDADLSDADLSDADLRGATLIDTTLLRTDFRYADLRFANFRGDILYKTDLRNADLEHANFRYADLSDAILKYAYFNSATYNSNTKFPDKFNPEEHGMIEVDEDGNQV